MASMTNLTITTTPATAEAEIATGREGRHIIHDAQDIAAEEMRIAFRSASSSYHGFKNTDDPDFQAMLRRLGAGISVRMLSRIGGAEAKLAYSAGDHTVTVTDPKTGPFTLPAGNLAAFCRGVNGMTALRKGYAPGELKRALSLVFRRPEGLEAGQLPLRVVDEQNVELDLLFATAAEAEDAARFFETLQRNAALADIESRHVTYFPPTGQSSAVKLSRKVRSVHLKEHRIHQHTDPEASKREMRRVHEVRLRQLAEQGFAELNGAFKAVLSRVQKGVAYVKYEHHGVSDAFFSKAKVRCTISYDLNHLVHIAEQGTPMFCGVTNAPASREFVYAVSEIHSVVLAHPVPTRSVLCNVPEPLWGRTVSLIFTTAEAHMTLPTEAEAELLVRFFRTVTWHREEQVLESKKVFLLELEDKAELAVHAEAADTDAPVA